MEQDVRAGVHLGRAQDEAPDQHGGHAGEHAQAEQIRQQAVNPCQAALTEEVKPGDETFEHVAQVDQQVIHEPPGDQGVEKAGPEADFEGGRERPDFQEHPAQAFGPQLPIWAAVTAPDDAHDPHYGLIDQNQRPYAGEDEQDFFRPCEHRIPPLMG